MNDIVNMITNGTTKFSNLLGIRTAPFSTRLAATEISATPMKFTIDGTMYVTDGIIMIADQE